MKLRNSLWAFALVFAAVSCSDDMEGPDKGNDNGAEAKGGYFMTVNIATGGGSSMTKANGEDGDGNLEETGNENKVHDVNVFLIEGDITSANEHLDLLNSEDAATTQITGQGYTSITDGATPDGGTEPNHDRIEVEMQLAEPIPGEDTKTYQVFTVVNAGQKLTNITTLASLRDYVHNATVWSGTVADPNKFVMSTHKMTGVPGHSVVTLSAANMNEGNPAVTNVYVERLAARIDLKVAESLLADGDGYTTTDQSAIAQNGTFELTGYTVVNRWKGESYMFKQVSPLVTDWETALPTETATYGTDDPEKYLGEETWNQTSTTNGTGTYNYVVEPKTREKNGTDFMTASYDNYFSAENTDLNDLESTEWSDLTGISTDFAKIAYTKENTMTAAQQLNGYSTGVIFESEFTPDENFKVSQYSEGEITDEATLAEGKKTFLVANHQVGTAIQKVVYADVKTIAAMAFDGLDETTMTEDMYKGFMDGEWPSTDPELTAVQTLINGMKESNKVEDAFKTYLSGIANAEDATWDNVKENLTYTKFLESDGGEALAEPTTVDAGYIGTLFEDFGVSYYNGGKSYHKFWIRHDNNDAPSVMGVMEFAIVRNNVYQLDVTGIRDLGDPLPYTPGKDDPANPDESSEVSILVNIYVKNWVVRKNDNIIL